MTSNNNATIKYHSISICFYCDLLDSVDI